MEQLIKVKQHENGKPFTPLIKILVNYINTLSGSENKRKRKTITKNGTRKPFTAPLRMYKFIASVCIHIHLKLNLYILM